MSLSPPQRSAQRRYLTILRDNITFVIFGLVTIGFVLFAPNFASLSTAGAILRITAIVSIMAVGMTFVIICGEIDLSVGSMASLSGMVGALLMQAGIPYDSGRGRAICGSLSAILTGQSYTTSAVMAEQMGAFPEFQKNRKSMLRVIRNHRRAAYGVPRDLELTDTSDMGDYEALQIKPVPIDADAIDQGEEHIGKLSNGRELIDRARIAWDSALKLGQEHGFRNAQTTVIAPTGTIGLLMDCDTTGVEPDFALVKFKKLAGGGYFKIANQSLRPALVALGYEKQQVKDILVYVMGALRLDVTMPESDGALGKSGKPFDRFLKDHGLLDADLQKIIDALPTVFELSHAFNAWTLGENAIERLGLTGQADKPGFDLLTALGLTKPQVSALNRVICGTQTVEGAPYLKDEHLPVFDCASTCGPTGERFIAPGGHIHMMAAAQPFISGAISKTINLPSTADVQDIKDAYRLSWELGLKANALYRDGCKLSQVLSNKVDVDDGIEDEEAVEAAKEEVIAEVAAVAEATSAAVTNPPTVPDRQPVEKIVERIVERPLRRRLPDTRMGKTHKFNVAGHEGYLTVGLYVEGNPGELFITMAKEGSTIGGLMDSLGTAISVALQYGVPIESLVNKFTHQRFEPAGITHNPEIPFAKSLVDYIFRWLGMEFVPGYRAANAPVRKPQPETPKPEQATEPVSPGNGNGNGHGGNGHDQTAGVAVAPAPALSTHAATESHRSALVSAMSQMQADAPACDACGTITVRNGTCYKCLNCGASLGCS